MFPTAKSPPGRNSLACFFVSSAIAWKAAVSICFTSSLPLALPRIRIMSSSARFDRSVTLAARQPLSCSLHDPSTIPCGRSAAAWKKASVSVHILGSTSRMCCASEPMRRSSIHKHASHISAKARTADMIASELKPVRMVWRSFPPVSPPNSVSSSRYVFRLPSCDKRSVTAASMKKT